MIPKIQQKLDTLYLNWDKKQIPYTRIKTALGSAKKTWLGLTAINQKCAEYSCTLALLFWYTLFLIIRPELRKEHSLPGKIKTLALFYL